MNILVNLSPLKFGGGQNVGLNFITFIESKTQSNEKFYFIVAKNSDIHKFFIQKKFKNYSVAPNNPILRMLSEIFFSPKLIKQQNIDIIYSYFGIGIFPENIPQVTGSADSNLYFPEINFWEGYKGLALLKKKIVDRYRIWGLKRANGIIFENKIMEERCHQIFKFRSITKFIKPSMNVSEDCKEYKLPLKAQSSSHKGLFLCGWQLNKNVMLLPLIASEIKKRDIDFHFILTAPQDDSNEHRQFLELIHQYEVFDYISIVGKIKKDQLASLYSQIDLVFLLSKLESFSNNIIEAWFFKKLLIISDAEWSKAICNDAALYVDRNSHKKIVDAIKYIIDNPAIYEKLILNGTNELKTYPSIEEKTQEEINFLRYVYENV